MRTDPLLIWIIILNWNGLDDTLDCLHSLSQIETSELLLHILVIDNNSAIDPRPAIHARFPAVQVVHTGRNLGFAGGCNYGIALALQADADYVLLLNNDTIVSSDFLSTLVDYARTVPELGVLAPLICYVDQPEQVWFGGAHMSLSLGLFRHRYYKQPRSQVPPQAYATPFVSGCCMLIPARILRSSGAFDAGYFAYFEDVDFCLRLRKAGLAVICLPSSVIWHKVSVSTRRNLAEGTTSPLKHYLMERNRIMTVRKHASPAEQSVFLLVTHTLLMSFFLTAFMLRRRWRKMVGITLGMLHGLQQRTEIPPL